MEKSRGAGTEVGSKNSHSEKKKQKIRMIKCEYREESLFKSSSHLGEALPCADQKRPFSLYPSTHYALRFYIMPGFQEAIIGYRTIYVCF